ncbi:GerMN domain-containing protein [Desulfosporosinus sp. Sb-LF]|uniref:GerMN domain-containing protein n=1 Tax=Desulfosporosinus sp. Sb-LF TaxID=2560027 RepID=UPI00107F37F5|nr:GerMN domain-containing protein [Desulfosporosinus sp. Sb-LF]TGE32150.1 hypothetical protein E4K68_13605 [Desulfosporosinus sp. Sb-LF]
MKRLTVFLLILILTVMTIGCTKTPLQAPTDQKPPQTQTEQTTPPVQVPSTLSANESQVKIYLIALNDNVKSGKDIGTGDSLVPVERTISTSNTPLKGAFDELLALKEPYYGQSGLYNALYRSKLTLDKATITNGKAEIYLSGSFSLGGVMDNPRVENQLNETALQFSTVREVQIYLNRKTLKDALSLK